MVERRQRQLHSQAAVKWRLRRQQGSRYAGVQGRYIVAMATHAVGQLAGQQGSGHTAGGVEESAAANHVESADSHRQGFVHNGPVATEVTQVQAADVAQRQAGHV